MRSPYKDVDDSDYEQMHAIASSIGEIELTSIDVDEELGVVGVTFEFDGTARPFLQIVFVVERKKESERK